MKKRFLGLIICLLLIVMNAVPVFAATGSVKFDDSSKQGNKGEQVKVDVNIKGDEELGTYYIQLGYDSRYMEYVSGAETGGNGLIVLKGTATGTDIKYSLVFKCLSGGTTDVYVKAAKVTTKASNSKEEAVMDISHKVDIQISGEVTVTDDDAGNEEIPICGATLEISGTKYYVVDLGQYIPKEADWSYTLVNGTINGNKLTYMVDSENSIEFLYLTDDFVNCHLYAVGADDGMLYKCNVFVGGDKKFYLANAKVSNAWPEELTLDAINRQAVYAVMDEDGHVGFYHLTDDGSLIKWDPDNASGTNTRRVYTWIFIISGGILLIIIGTALVRTLTAPKDKDEITSRETIEIQTVDLEEEEEELIVEKVPRPSDVVINVSNVTMKFRISNSNASGLKEYFIQLITRKINYRELYALDNVSFTVKKGDVVGIIGSNGSGKSTLLRIISGALSPTMGRVKVDRRKLQILTLGTGFDMELTARENIYLNGAIIGLTKEFIDENFDRIIEFAELQGFVDEKVKNFSSGMVSRLGFAIATAGEVAEILILDEVLSVGDESFRKKSLARIKEMMHSGSTVLMVSHSMQNIIENCNKVVWIEKGKLMMVGEAKEVCDAYRASIK